MLKRNESLRDELLRTRRELKKQHWGEESEQKARDEKKKRKPALEVREEATERVMEERKKLNAVRPPPRPLPPSFPPSRTDC